MGYKELNIDISKLDREVWDVNDFNYEWFYSLPLLRHQNGEPRRAKRVDYINAIATLDIETTNLPEFETAICYIWQFCINGILVGGRSLNSLKTFFNKLCYTMDERTRLMCYVHNLAFEFHHLREVLPFTEVFSVDRRHPIKCEYRNIEFRCSYAKTNLSLNDFLEKMEVVHAKSEMDYKVRRFSWTHINAEDTMYCFHDVLGLYEALRKEIRNEKDTLYTTPLTSTGYTRRDVKEVMKNYSHSPKFKAAIPDIKLQFLLNDAFRGGNTHANRWISGKLIQKDGVLIHSKDIASSYPARLVFSQYPMTPFKNITIKQESEMEFLKSINKAVVTRITLFDIDLRSSRTGCPYIPISKCTKKVGAVEDNGRVISADMLEITITDIDYWILADMYKWDDKRTIFTDTYISDYGYLPTPLRKLIIKYFKKKTELKDREGFENEYNKFKNRFNAIYGLTVQFQARPLIIYDEDADGLFRLDKNKTIEETYNKNIQSIATQYAWGVWCTCHARKALQDGINMVEAQYDNGALFLYTDTDSIKYIGNVDFEPYNRPIREACERVGAVAKTVTGKNKYLGIYEDEDDMSAFITHGAKKYCYILAKDGSLHLTCAGVSKEKGAKELERIENFTDGFVFKTAAGLKAQYNDHPTNRELIIDNHLVQVNSNIYLSDTTYTVGKSEKYGKLLAQNEYRLFYI